MKDLKEILNSERGIALIMVMTAIILLMAIWGEFTFESKISRIKTVNILDKAQAKLLAESGVQMAMARLRLYKEASNYLAGNKAAKDSVPPQLLNQLWEVPYLFPLPVGKDASRSFKDAAEKFQEESLMDGEMNVVITNISNRLNLNVLRYDLMKNPKFITGEETANFTLRSGNNDPEAPSMPEAIFAHMQKSVQDKKDKDEAFADKYSNIEIENLLASLQHYTTDKNIPRSDINPDIDRGFDVLGITPKYGPFTSQSELYMMPGWTDELIDLIGADFSVYPNNVIDFNKMNKSMLKLLIPTIDEQQMTDFFEYRDNPETPRYMNNLEDFKKYITGVGQVLSEAVFDERFQTLTKLGVEFGSSPQIFKITSVGTYNRSTYTVIAVVYIPKQKGAQGQGQGQGQGQSGQQQDQSTQLLEPRIIEIQVN